MNIVTYSKVVANRAALELRPLAAYLDAHDAGRAPVNANSYRCVAERIRILLSPHLENPHVRQFCQKSQSLYEMLGNLLVEQDRGLALEMEYTLEQAKATAYWLR
jgi:hypothetical protein